MSRLRIAVLSAVALTLVTGSVAYAAQPRPEAPVAVQPGRILDTRSNVGARGPVTPGAPITVAIPQATAAGATAVFLNLTATEAAGSGWAKVWPCGEPMPTTSSINFTPNRNVANAVLVKLPAGGVCMASNVPVHLIADVTGWFTGSDDFTGSSPNRLLDTRDTNTPITLGQERRLVVAGRPGIAANATMAALNVTIDRPQGAGFVVAYPCGTTTNSSTVNFSAGETVANLTIVGLGQGQVCFRSNTTVDLVIDSYGWSSGAGRLRVGPPTRLIDTRDAVAWTYGQPSSGGKLELSVAGRGGVPADADAALVTVTITNPTAEGFVTVWPCDQPLPVASTINTWPSALRSNLAFVKLSANSGTACLRYQASDLTPVDLVVDVVGWVTGGPARTVPSVVGTFTSAGAPTGPVQFYEEFRTPEGFYTRFQTQVFHGVNEPPQVREWQGDHNHACEGPVTTRTIHVDRPDEMYWWCAPKGPDSGHIMTSMYTTGYAQVNFAPNQVFTNITRVCWDQNQTEMGGRKWTQLVVVPEATYQANGRQLNYVKPPLENDVAANGLRISESTFLLEMLRASTVTYVGHSVTEANYAGFTTPDKARRFKTCVSDMANGTVRIQLERPTGTEVRFQRGSFPDGDVRVIFQDDNYDPPKDAASTSSLATWHWDNIEIA